MPLPLVRRDVLCFVVVTLCFLALNQLLAFLLTITSVLVGGHTKGPPSSSRTFNSGSSPLDIQWRRTQIKRDLLATPFSAYFLFIVRSRNSCINDPIRSTSSSTAKWPVSRR